MQQIITNDFPDQNKNNFLFSTYLQLLYWAAHSPKSLLGEKFLWRTSTLVVKPTLAVSQATSCKAWKCSPVETQQHLTGAERSPDVLVSICSKLPILSLRYSNDALYASCALFTVCSHLLLQYCSVLIVLQLEFNSLNHFKTQKDLLSRTEVLLINESLHYLLF